MKKQGQDHRCTRLKIPLPYHLCVSTMVKITHRRPKILGGEEDHDDAAVAEESDDPEDEEEDAEHVGD